MKSAMPWILIVALLAGGFFLFSANREKEAQLAKLTQDNAEFDNLRKENDELKRQSVSPEELARLRKDHEEALRLRGEVQRLRAENKQMSAQLAAAQAQTLEAQQAAQVAAENEASRTNAETIALIQAQMDAHNHDLCVNNLRLIDGAKQTWALENKKTPADVPTADELAPYLPKDTPIACPSGGTYAINAVSQPPTCSVPGHELK